MNWHLRKILTIQTTKQYFRIKLWRLNIYFSRHPLSIRQGGIEKTRHKQKRIQFKESLLSRRHCCEHCGRPLDWNTASIHHIVPKSIDPSREFDEDNVLMLCPGCHVRIHRIEQLEAKKLRNVC